MNDPGAGAHRDRVEHDFPKAGGTAAAVEITERTP